MHGVFESFNIQDFSNIINEYGLDKRLDTYEMFENLHYSVTYSNHDYEFTAGAVCDWLNSWEIYTRNELIWQWREEIGHLIDYNIMPDSMAEDYVLDANLANEGGFYTNKGVYYIPSSDTSTLMFEPLGVD